MEPSSSTDKRALTSEERKERKERKRAKQNSEALAAAAAATAVAMTEAAQPEATAHPVQPISSAAIASAVAAAAANIESQRGVAAEPGGTLAPAPAAPVMAAAPTAEPPAPPAWAFPSEDSLPHLCCSVCLSFPEAEVLQCHMGHILCRECHDRVCVEQKPTCPTCRTPIDALKPVRNVALEQTIALLPVQCPNKPCAEKLTRGSLARHLEHECKQRQCGCKYALLGCKWSGVFAEWSAHVDQCKKAEMPGYKLLRRVAETAQETAKKHEEARAESLRYQKIVEMMGSRCKAIGVFSLTLHKCSASEHVAGRPAHLMTPAFHALGFRFKLYTVPEPASGSTPPRYLAVLKLCDSRMPLPIDLFLLSAPGTSVEVGPVSHRHTFASSRNRSTEPLLLAEGPAAEALNELETIQLRLGVIDRRSGRLSRPFQGQMASSRWVGGGGEEGVEGGWDSDGYGESHSMVEGDDLDESEGPSDGSGDEDMPLGMRERMHDRHHAWNFY